MHSIREQAVSALWHEQDIHPDAARSMIEQLNNAGYSVIPNDPPEEVIIAMKHALSTSRRSGISGMTLDSQFRAMYAPELAAYRAILKAAE